jgi:hypothetical protein
MEENTAGFKYINKRKQKSRRRQKECSTHQGKSEWTSFLQNNKTFYMTALQRKLEKISVKRKLFCDSSKNR